MQGTGGKDHPPEEGRDSASWFSRASPGSPLPRREHPSIDLQPRACLDRHLLRCGRGCCMCVCVCVCVCACELKWETLIAKGNTDCWGFPPLPCQTHETRSISLSGRFFFWVFPSLPHTHTLSLSLSLSLSRQTRLRARPLQLLWGFSRAGTARGDRCRVRS